MSVIDAPSLIEAVDIEWPTGSYIPHEPTARQHAFLWLPHVEAMYGGAAGGGKSDAMLMAALQYIDRPGYAALLLRKTYNELMLEGALLDRAQKWLGHTNCSWNGETRRFTFPSGATLTFGFLSNMQDRARYQSSEFQFIGFDELTAFDEPDYRFMFSRLRKTEDQGDIPLRMRSATNPGGRGHKWVKERFIDPFVKNEYSPKRAFIPAKLADNPHIDQVSYREALEQLEPELAAQLLDGDWDAREPGYWMLKDPRWIDACVDLGAKMWNDHLSGRKRLPAPMTITNKGLPVLGLTNCIDWGEHTQSYVIWPLQQGGIFIPPSEVVGISEDPAEVTKRIIEQTLKFEYPLCQSNYDAAGIQSMRTYIGIVRKLQRFRDLRTTGIAFGKYKRESINYMRTLARRSYVGEFERVLAIHPENRELIRQLRRWERKDDESDEAVKEDDHGPDSVVAGIALVARKHRDYIDNQVIDSYENKDNAYDDGEGVNYGD